MVAAEPKEGLAISKKAAGERTEFEIDGTLFKLFAMYETTNAQGCAIIACAYYLLFNNAVFVVQVY